MQYKTLDGIIVETGEQVFSHYTMTLGLIHEDEGLDHPYKDMVDPNDKRWFRFRSQASGSALLNGERVCSVQHAERMGWLDSDIKEDGAP